MAPELAAWSGDHANRTTNKHPSLRVISTTSMKVDSLF